MPTTTEELITLTWSEARALLQRAFNDAADYHEWEADVLDDPPEDVVERNMISVYRKCACVPGVWLPARHTRLKIEPLDR